MIKKSTAVDSNRTLAIEALAQVIKNEGIPTEDITKVVAENDNSYNRYKVSFTYKDEWTFQELCAYVQIDTVRSRVLIDIYKTEGDQEMRCLEIVNGDLIDDYTGEVLIMNI